MTYASAIITNALRHHLNRLSPGETLDAETGALCLAALNDVVDSLNFEPGFLQQETFTTAAASSTGSTLTYGSGGDFTTLPNGLSPLGLNAIKDGQEWALQPITLQEYQFGFGSEQTEPHFYAVDGYGTIYLRGDASGHTFKIRHRAPATSFADLSTTNYTLASGVASILSTLLAEQVAEVLTGRMPPGVMQKAARTRRRLIGRAAKPDILNVRRPKSPAPSSVDAGGGEPGLEVGEYDVTLETFVINFNEFSGYLPLEGAPATSTITGDLGTELEFSFWHTPGVGALYDSGIWATNADVLPQRPDAGTFPLVYVRADDVGNVTVNPVFWISFPLDKTNLPEPAEVYTTQFLNGFLFNYFGQVYATITDTGEGTQQSTSWAPLVGWATSTTRQAVDEFGVPTSNNVIRFDIEGFPEFMIDDVEITIGTRTAP